MTQTTRPDSPPAPPPASPPALNWRYLPHVLIFFSSACVMVMELVAGRLTGRHMGTSLYTWTSIIGVVLAGISLGNWIGGKMADRWTPGRLLGWLFFASSVLCVLCLAINHWVAEAKSFQGITAELRLGYRGQVFAAMLVIFLLPALALGTISPVTAKMALSRGGGVGQTIGSVYAFGAMGSILGTFLTGFYLIAALGSTGVVLAVAAMLALLGVALGPWRLVGLAWLITVAVLLWLSQTSSAAGFQVACTLGLQDGQVVTAAGGTRYAPHVFARESDYQYVKVRETSGRNSYRPGRELMLDVSRHSFVALDDPAHLEYAYLRIYAALMEAFFPQQKPIHAFFIGGGGFTFPRWVQERYPGSGCEVAEIDPVVVQASHAVLGLPRDTAIRIHVADARIVVRDLPADRRYDLIVGDAFNNELTIPWHLATLQFHQQLKRHLKPGGVMLTNLIDDYEAGGRLTGAYLLTVRRVFKHVHVFCTDRSGVSAGHDNFVVAATDRDDPELHLYLGSLLPGHVQAFPGSLLTPVNLEVLARRCGGRILTDDDAPVENLIAPIAR